MDWLATKGADFGLKVLAAIATWIIGRWIISAVLKLVEKAINRTGRIGADAGALSGVDHRVVLNIIH